jgi:hypothetical protein
MDITQKATETVELALQELGLTPEEVRCAEEGQWLLFREQFEIYLDVWHQDEVTPWNYFKPEGELAVFQVSVPVFFLPEKRTDELMQELLAVNMNLFYAAFTVNPNEKVVLLKYKRLADNLTVHDVVEAIEACGYYAEMTFNVLKEEFDLHAVQTEQQ